MALYGYYFKHYFDESGSGDYYEGRAVIEGEGLFGKKYSHSSLGLEGNGYYEIIRRPNWNYPWDFTKEEVLIDEYYDSKTNKESFFKVKHLEAITSKFGTEKGVAYDAEASEYIFTPTQQIDFGYTKVLIRYNFEYFFYDSKQRCFDSYLGYTILENGTLPAKYGKIYDARVGSPGAPGYYFYKDISTVLTAGTWKKEDEGLIQIEYYNDFEAGNGKAVKYEVTPINGINYDVQLGSEIGYINGNKFSTKSPINYDGSTQLTYTVDASKTIVKTNIPWAEPSTNTDFSKANFDLMFWNGDTTAWKPYSEGNNIKISIKTNVNPGVTIYYSISGNGIDKFDFDMDALSGSLTASDKGYMLDSETNDWLTTYIKKDAKTEGVETLNIKLFSDAARTTQVGSTASVSIADTSITQTYTLTPSATSINEGSLLATRVEITNGDPTTIYYSLSGTGITAADFSSGALTGSGGFSFADSFSFSHTLANDLTTEGLETLNIKLFSDAARTIQVGTTASVSIVDTSFALTYFNPSTNKTLNSWTAYQVTNSVKAGDIVSQWFGTAAPATTQLQDISETKLMDVVANTWADKVQINRVVKASDAGGKIEAKQINLGSGEVAGSVISGSNGNDDIKGYAGWDIIDGGAGDDLIHGGNGRDILTGGTGRDELHGDFGWNTYKSEKDGVSDLIAIKSDHYLVNWLYGKAGNSPNGEKSDIIEGLDPIDKIRIIGVDTSEITFTANVITKGVTGIGIYGKGILEALYTGGDLTVAQITQMTSGDASVAAMSNSVNSYGTW